MVELLMREQPPPRCRMGVGEHDEGGAIEERTSDPVHDGGHTWSERRQASAQMSRCFALRQSCDGATSLCRRENERKTRAARCLDEIEVASAARHTEDRGY